jgi:hypothetical protein
MINLERHVEERRSPTVSAAELIRSGLKVVVGGRGLDVGGQAWHGREA